MPRRSRSLAIVFLLAAWLLPAAAAPAALDMDAVRAKAVSWAVEQGGHREVGTTNCSSLITRWEQDMGIAAPPCREWCGALPHQAFLRAGVRLSIRMIDPDRSYADAIARRRGLRRIRIADVRPGDLLFFAFRSGLRASHVALVRGRPRNGRVRTVEGNVGHHVTVQERGMRYPVLAARVTGPA